MNNIEPWCVSRQLWWGHQIPAWYGPDKKIFVEINEIEAKKSAKKLRCTAGIIVSLALNKIIKTIFGLVQNIVLVGMFIGLALNYFEIPFPNTLQNIMHPIAELALPTVLISMGMSLGGFKLTANLSYSIILTTLKNFIHPLIAFILAKYILFMPPMLVFIVTIAAALPSGTQTYYFSYRYNSLQNIISTNVVISTFVSFFTLSLILLVFGY